MSIIEKQWEIIKKAVKKEIYDEKETDLYKEIYIKQKEDGKVYCWRFNKIIEEITFFPTKTVKVIKFSQEELLTIQNFLDLKNEFKEQLCDSNNCKGDVCPFYSCCEIRTIGKFTSSLEKVL